MLMVPDKLSSWHSQDPSRSAVRAIFFRRRPPAEKATARDCIEEAISISLVIFG